MSAEEEIKFGVLRLVRLYQGVKEKKKERIKPEQSWSSLCRTCDPETSRRSYRQVDRTREVRSSLQAKGLGE